MIFRVTFADMQWPCDGRSLSPMSSVFSAFSLFAHRLLILPLCFLFSPIFRCCNRMPKTRSSMRKVVYFVYSLQAKDVHTQGSCKDLLLFPLTVERGRECVRKSHNTRAAGLYNNRLAPHPCDPAESRLPSWQQGLLSLPQSIFQYTSLMIGFQHELCPDKPHSNPSKPCSLASWFSPRNWMAQKMFWPIINTSQKLQKPEKSHFEKFR